MITATPKRPPLSAGPCDECQQYSSAGRIRAAIKAGPLRGIASGLVCHACLARRGKPAAAGKIEQRE